MSWQNEMVLLVRYLVDDVTKPQVYDDGRLEQTILASAQLIRIEGLSFEKTYTVDIDSCTLTPDPTTGTKDDAYINLVSVKTACLIINAEAKTRALDGVRIIDGPSQIDLRESTKAMELRANQMCKHYENIKIQYQLGNSKGAQAIMGPYTTERAFTLYGNFS